MDRGRAGQCAAGDGPPVGPDIDLYRLDGGSEALPSQRYTLAPRPVGVSIGANIKSSYHQENSLGSVPTH
jgi:hypothetical protein